MKPFQNRIVLDKPPPIIEDHVGFRPKVSTTMREADASVTGVLQLFHT